MTTIITGGALLTLLMGQQTGSELLDAALGQDVDPQTLMKEIESFVSLGVQPTDALLITAALFFGVRLLGWTTPLLNTLNDWLRKRLQLNSEAPPQG